MKTPQNWQDRTELLIGKEQTERLRDASVLVVGLGGVGAVAAEMLCRAGIGHMDIVDGDRIEASNLNRQLPALVPALGQYKTDLVSKRLKNIHPDLDLRSHTVYLQDDSIPALLDSGSFDCILDAIDTLTPKIQLARAVLERGIPLIACMGAGARLDPEKISCADISGTFNCPLAKAYRNRLAKIGIRNGIQAVFSSELPIRSAVREDFSGPHKRSTVGTISFMPALFGCHCAAAVIRTLQDASSRRRA